MFCNNSTQFSSTSREDAIIIGDNHGLRPREFVDPIDVVPGVWGGDTGARSRLYRNKILQANMRLKALNEIYTMHSFALL